MIKKFSLFSVLLTLFFSLMQSITYASIPAESSLAPMLQTVLPSVVNIRAQIKITDFQTLLELQKQQKNSNRSKNGDEDQDDFTSPPKTFGSMGSGVIINTTKGYILTNAHVIANAKTITVTLSDGRHFTAKLIGMDSPSDIALLQIKADRLTAIKIGDSSTLKVGDFVAAIGNPFGLNQTVTSGIISALGRTTLGIENYENFIQTDAPINPGNSGGALINLKGELIGINTAILAPNQGSVGIGFAIPVDMAMSVSAQLIAFGNVKRGTLGVGAQDITPELAQAFGSPNLKGAAITQVLQNSPAALAGLQVGDIVTSINGNEIKNANDIVNAVAFLRVNSKISLNVMRHNKTLKLSASLLDAKSRATEIADKDPFLYGIGLKNFKLLSPIHGNIQGIAVISVEEDSNAWHADLRPGDIITSVNQKAVNNIDELKSETSKAKKQILVNIIRGPNALFIVINKTQEP